MRCVCSISLKKIEIQKVCMYICTYGIYGIYDTASTHKVANFARCKLREHPFQLQLSTVVRSVFAVGVCCIVVVVWDWEKFEVTWLP